MNEALKELVVRAGAPEQVMDQMWFHVFCQKFAGVIFDELEKDAGQE